MPLQGWQGERGAAWVTDDTAVCFYTGRRPAQHVPVTSCLVISWSADHIIMFIPEISDDEPLRRPSRAAKEVPHVVSGELPLGGQDPNLPALS